MKTLLLFCLFLLCSSGENKPDVGVKWVGGDVQVGRCVDIKTTRLTLTHGLLITKIITKLDAYLYFSPLEVSPVLMCTDANHGAWLVQ